MADPTPTPDPEPQPDPVPDPEPNEPNWKAEARKHEREAKALRDRIAKIEADNQTDAERAVAAAKDEGRNEALSLANDRILRSEVKALAAQKLADPSDAVAMLDLTDFTVDENGDVDSKAIAKAIDALVADKPYLAATTGPRVPGVPTGVRTAPANPDMNAMIRAAAGRG